MLNGTASPYSLDFDNNSLKFLNSDHPSKKGTWLSNFYINFWTFLLMFQGLKGSLIDDKIIDKFEIIENGVKKEIFEL